MASVKPSIWPPTEGIQGFVGIAVWIPTVQENLRFCVRDIIAIAIWNEHQVRGCSHPHTAKPNFQSADQIEPFLKNLTNIETMVSIGIFQNEDAVLPVISLRPVRILMPFSHPHATTVIETEGNRLSRVRLGCKNVCLKAFWKRHGLDGFLGFEAGKEHLIDHRHCQAFAGLHRIQDIFEFRLLCMKTKVIKVDVPPVPRLVIHHPNLHGLTLSPPKIDDNWP